MLFPLLFLCSIHFVISLSHQEDLSITKYSQIGCLRLQSDKQFFVNHIQENSLLSYQTFSSSHMTIELCFRLCRQWIILISNNRTNCICLYTINKVYEFNEYLGEVLPNERCISNDVQIYSLTKDTSILPLLLSPASDDWSVDGCYYLHSIQNISPDKRLNHVHYDEAIDLCRKHCRRSPEENHYSYFLSRKKFCYCSPINLSQTLNTKAVRKPLIHCSFLSYICQGFVNSCKKYSYETNNDTYTLIKINVHHYCSSTEFIPFIFDRTFYLCLKSIFLSKSIFSLITLISDKKCLPIIIKTFEQWNYLIQSSWITYSKIFILIDRNSTYIFNDLFKDNNLTLSSNDLCIMTQRTGRNQTVYELTLCTAVRSPNYVLCAQKPFQPMTSNEEQFQMINNESEIAIDEILSCPPEFVLFNKICYYIHVSFMYDIRSGKRLCANKYSNSTLVKFDSHEWGNINPTKFLGRTFDDILLEFFYYLLEEKLLNQSVIESNGKHWLRLFLGNKNDPNECGLRYFTRVSGAFTVLDHCNDGGHPVCQCEPIRTKTSTKETISNINNSSIETKTESTTPMVVLNSTEVLSSLNTTIIPICENCTMNPPADEDLANNETQNDIESYNNTLIETTNEQPKKKSYLSLILILTSLVLALIVLFIGIGILILRLRDDHGSYSTRSSIIGGRRVKRSSTTLTISDIPNTPAVLYTRLKPPRISSTDTDMLLPFDNSLLFNDDNIEIMTATNILVINDENKNKEDDEEPLYATLK